MSDNKTILLVEDDELYRDAINTCISREYEVEMTESAEGALQYLNKKVPDLILLDINLPGMDGVELLRTVKSKWVDIRVIMVTAMDDLALIAKVKKLRAFAYLVKPFTAEILLETIQRALHSPKS